ncbi:MAG: sortase [Burkholderiaceae bacterium]
MPGRRTVPGGLPGHRPWSWADLSPVARLVFERQGVDLIVLDNDAPRTLAFGPGLRAGTPAPGMGGNSVVSAHRDTHFAVLGSVLVGDMLNVQTLDGREIRYRISEQRIVDVDDAWIAEDQVGVTSSLVTCWPLDSADRGRQAASDRDRAT